MLINVTAAIIMQKGMILIAKRGFSDELPGQWEFPGGKVEKGETYEECLQRELREELQVEAEIGEFFAESCYEHNGRAIRILAYFACIDTAEISSTVHEEVKWVPLPELSDYNFMRGDQPLVERLLSNAFSPAGLPRSKNPCSGNRG